MNIIEAIKERRSVRSYDGKGLTEAEIQELNSAISQVTSPFGDGVTIRIKSFDKMGDYKPGTYGMIKGAVSFFLLAYASGDEAAISAGFMFEQIVLKAWEMGLGTCWIAATFNGSDFERGQQWPEGEKLKVVSPVGRSAKRSLIEKVARFTVGSDKRKPFESLFFNDDFNHPLSKDTRFGESLDMLRLAPSSTNSQPWRALVDGNTVHFYYIPKSKLSVLDCGIGLCHFSEVEKFQGFKGEFFVAENPPQSAQGWRYLRSYRAL